MQHFLSAVESCYISDHPYHNAIHATDVLQMCHLFIVNGAKGKFLSEMDALALVTAAVCHDMGHPGLSNAFLINSNDPLALQYNDTNVLEHFHAFSCFKTMLQDGCDIFSPLAPEDFKVLRYRVIQLILATDLKDHFSLISEFRTKVRVVHAFIHIIACVLVRLHMYVYVHVCDDDLI